MGWQKGSASAYCALPCPRLLVPPSDPCDRGDMCLVRGCAEEVFSLVLPGGRSGGDGKRVAEI